MCTSIERFSCVCVRPPAVAEGVDVDVIEGLGSVVVGGWGYVCTRGTL